MRSLLFVPGDSERKLEKGLSSGADVLIIDLEDSVSLENKPAARQTAAAFIAERRHETSAAIYVRVNDLRSGLTDDDLAAVIAARPDGIMLPKSESGADVEQLSAMLRVAEAENGVEDGATRILPIITETAAAVLAASTYRGNSTGRLAGLTWGAEDLSADIGASATRRADGSYADVFRLARALTLLAASASGIPAIDTVYPDFRNIERFRQDCIDGERDGFTGRMAIHPSQVEVINAVFTPSPEAVEKAEMLVSAFAAAGNPGVVAIGGQMYDGPHLRRAERLLARARAASERSSG